MSDFFQFPIKILDITTVCKYSKPLLLLEVLNERKEITYNNIRMPDECL